MLFRTHLVFAFLIFFISYPFFENIFLFGLFIIFSTLFVDIDHNSSKLGKLFIFRPLQFFFSHRGIFHSLFFGILFSSLIFILDFSAGFGFLFGYLLHLLLDCFSLSGVYLFLPFSKIKFKGFIPTGGIFEEILFVLGLLVNLFLVFKWVL